MHQTNQNLKMTTTGKIERAEQLGTNYAIAMWASVKIKKEYYQSLMKDLDKLMEYESEEVAFDILDVYRNSLLAKSESLKSNVKSNMEKYALDEIVKIKNKYKTPCE